MRQELLQKFYQVFEGEETARVFFAPGRVNLIGEHTDYNGGHVFPCALTIGTYAVARKNQDKTLRFYSANFEELGMLVSSLDELTYRKEEDWINYPKGVLWALKEQGYTIDSGMDILYFGTIPNGSGLSSSASIEVLTGFVAKELFDLDVSMIDLALLGQKAENQYIGVNCGIMDQFAIAMGKENQAIFLDTADLSYEYAPLKLDGIKIVIVNTNKKRGLGESKYNERRSECELSLKELQKVLQIKSLGDLTIAMFEENQELITNETNRKRAKHAVYENQRTIQAVAALKEGNLTRFGELMTQSGISLRDDYEVTGLELDAAVSAMLAQPGVLGARMTGAGFGGCAVSLVKEEMVDQFIDNVGKRYVSEIGYEASFYVVSIGNGPIEL